MSYQKNFVCKKQYTQKSVGLKRLLDPENLGFISNWSINPPTQPPTPGKVSIVAGEESNKKLLIHDHHRTTSSLFICNFKTDSKTTPSPFFNLAAKSLQILNMFTLDYFKTIKDYVKSTELLYDYGKIFSQSVSQPNSICDCRSVPVSFWRGFVDKTNILHCWGVSYGLQ